MEYPYSNEITFQSHSQTDYSLDEHIFSQITSKSFDLSQLHYLRRENPVIFFTQSGKKIAATIVFTEDYSRIQIFIKKREKSIQTNEIKEISQSSIIQVKKEEDNLFPVRLKTYSKQYLLAFFTRENRTEWCSGLDALLKLSISYTDPERLKNYCEVMIRCQNMNTKITALNENRKTQQKTLKKLEKKSKKSEKDIIKRIVKELLIKVEIKLYKRKIKEAKFQIENLESEKILIGKNQEILAKAITRKNQEADLLRESLQGFKDQIFIISQKEAKKPSARKTWAQVLPFLTFSELLKLRSVSKCLKKLVSSYLSIKESWEILIKFNLYPRWKSWPMYINFYARNTYISSPSQKKITLNFSLTSISKFSLPVQEVFLSFCTTFGLSACFEELAKVSNFLFCTTRSQKSTFSVLFSLVHPPFYVLEIWKPGLLRLRLGIYQVQKLLKLRHPHLNKHFQEINISLDYIIGPWIGSIFTCYCLDSEENKGLQRIWDLFLIYGWDSIITTCMAILHNSQSRVIGESLEFTLKYYESKLDDQEICKAVDSYSIDIGLLNDLERSFYAALNPHVFNP